MNRSLALRGAILGALALAPAAAHAQAGNLLRVVPTCGSTQFYKSSDAGQFAPATVDYFGNTCTPTGASTTNAPGTSGSQAQSVQGVNGGVPQAITPGPGTITNPTDVSVAAGSTQVLTSATSRKYLKLVNTGTSLCRVGYSGITPSATRGDPLLGAASAGGQGGSVTFETAFVPNGTVTAFCAAASTFAVIEGN